jgi:S-adenosylmethionine hydrolase
MKPPLITLLTDYGTRDNFLGVLKGVLLSVCPVARLVDLSHEVPPQDVLSGAFLLKSAVNYFPKGSIHLAVVDPGVGSSRRPVAMRSNGHFFVGPDNGLFAAALEEWGIEEAVELTEKQFHLKNPSATFHGRDIFAPVAAHLARGTAFGSLGKKTTRWVEDSLPKPRKTKRGFEGRVLWVDRFGNLITNFEAKHLRPGSRFKVGSREISRLGCYYEEADPGGLLALLGSSNYLEISVNRGRADEELGAPLGTKVLLQ